MTPTAYRSPVSLGDRVLIDGCDSIVATVTAILWRTENPQAEIAYFNNGAQVTAGVADWRLTAAPES